MTKNKKSRMYEVNGKRVRTWNIFKGCRYNCIYCVQREQAKRQKHRCEKCYSYEPHFHAERLGEKFKAGETVFVAAAGDISFATTEQHKAILDVIKNNPKTLFYMQSKKPACFFSFDIFPNNLVLGTTIETNRGFPNGNVDYPYSEISQAPFPISRVLSLRVIKNARKYITIEPILDFDLDIVIAWLEQIAPEFAYVGYLNPLWKAKKLRLPEPPLEKTKCLCEELAKFMEVRLKTMRKGWDEK